MSLLASNNDGKGLCRSTTPDVCKVPPGVPVPFVNTARTQDAITFSTKVFITGDNALRKRDLLRTSKGDEPGSQGGVRSGVNRGKAQYTEVAHSNVFFDGKLAAHHQAELDMNMADPNCKGKQVEANQTAKESASVTDQDVDLWIRLCLGDTRLCDFFKKHKDDVATLYPIMVEEGKQLLTVEGPPMTWKERMILVEQLYQKETQFALRKLMYNGWGSRAMELFGTPKFPDRYSHPAFAKRKKLEILGTSAQSLAAFHGFLQGIPVTSGATRIATVPQGMGSSVTPSLPRSSGFPTLKSPTLGQGVANPPPLRVLPRLVGGNGASHKMVAYVDGELYPFGHMDLHPPGTARGGTGGSIGMHIEVPPPLRGGQGGYTKLFLEEGIQKFQGLYGHPPGTIADKLTGKNLDQFLKELNIDPFRASESALKEAASKTSFGKALNGVDHTIATVTPQRTAGGDLVVEVTAKPNASPKPPVSPTVPGAKRTVAPTSSKVYLEPRKGRVPTPVNITPGTPPPKLKSVDMEENFRGEHLPSRVWGAPTKYLNAEERAVYRLQLRDGKFYDSTGKVFDTTGSSTHQFGSQNRAIFVMDEYGNTYAAKNPHMMDNFAHSSFLSGGPVASAGEFEVINGSLQFISNKSGHYLPPWWYIRQGVEEWSRQGLSVRGVRFEILKGFNL